MGVMGAAPVVRSRLVEWSLVAAVIIALAMAFADRADVPRHIILSLASDQAEVSGLLIARSHLLRGSRCS